MYLKSTCRLASSKLFLLDIKESGNLAISLSPTDILK